MKLFTAILFSIVAAQAADTPILTAVANEGNDIELFQGWPMLLRARLIHPLALRAPAGLQPLTLGSDAQPWANGLGIEVRNAIGELQNWPLRALTTPSNTITLDAQTAGELRFYLDGGDTAQLAAGTYTILLRLDPALPRTIYVRLSAEPAALSPAQDRTKALLQAHSQILLGNLDRAAGVLTDFLQRQPGPAEALALEGDLLTQQGKTAEAAAYYSRAIAAVLQENRAGGEPPSDLLSRMPEVAPDTASSIMAQRMGRR